MYIILQTIPFRESGKKDVKKQIKVKPMSASDEKKIDEAIAMANQFADQSSQEFFSSSPKTPEIRDNSQGDSGISGSEASPRLKSMFSGLRKTSPKPEKRTFTDEIANVSDFSEEVTPEAQEAYNLLVVRGSVQKKDRDDRTKVRERRTRRALEHQRHSSKSPDRTVVSRNVNQHIRAPQGIPGRRSSTHNDVDEVPDADSNPLRRLRDSQRFLTRPRPSSVTATDLGGKEVVNGHVSSGRGLDAIRKPNLTPHSQFLSKLRDSDSEGTSPSPTHLGSSDTPLRMVNTSSSEDMSISPSGSVNPLPVPPRRPLRPSTIGVPPKGRKYPLDLSEKTNGPKRKSSSRSSSDLPPPPPPPPPPAPEQADQDSTRDSEDSVFSESVPEPIIAEKRFSMSMFTCNSPYSVKAVKCSAEEMGINDNADVFWKKEVKFEDLPTSHDLEDNMMDENAPMPGRYKTSDNVSYEDLLEFALDDSPDK